MTVPRRRSRKPTPPQLRATKAVVRWYLATYFRTAEDQGTPAMFMDRRRLGDFAVRREDLRGGDGDALFKLLVATTLFQRRQDVQVAKILRGVSARDARELSSKRRLLVLADATPCRALRTSRALHERCDLHKERETGRAACTHNPRTSCHLKRHTATLQRYGDFGKAPTSAALVLREAGARDLADWRRMIMKRVKDPAARASAFENALSMFWRIDKKIASMFLSAVADPDLSPGAAPWSRGVDRDHFVVIDSNVDAFLRTIGFRRGRSYDDRRAFVQALARRIDLRRMDSRLSRSYGPRIVQQAMYLFMSAANRRAIARNCMHKGPGQCRRCPRNLRDRCPVNQKT